MKTLLLILISIPLFIAGCGSKENNTKKQVQIEPKQQDTIKREMDKRRSLNDNLVKKLIQKYPSSLITDSIEDSYTYFLQQQLGKKSNLLLFSEADITDFEATNRGYFLITINSYLPRIVGRFKVQEPLATRLIKELKPHNNFENGCFVVNVKTLYPINNTLTMNIEGFDVGVIENSESARVSEDDIRENVGIDLNSGLLYLINGDLIDYYII